MSSVNVSRGGKPMFTTPKDFRRQNDMPYGVWRLKDEDVLFNRFYEPLWRCRPGTRPIPADPKAWIRDWETQAWFYNDGHSDREKWWRAETAADLWGV